MVQNSQEVTYGKGTGLMKEDSRKTANKGTGHRKRLRDRFLKSGLDGFADYEVIELLLT